MWKTSSLERHLNHRDILFYPYVCASLASGVSYLIYILHLFDDHRKFPSLLWVALSLSLSLSPDVSSTGEWKTKWTLQIIFLWWCTSVSIVLHRFLRLLFSSPNLNVFLQICALIKILRAYARNKEICASGHLPGSTQTVFTRYTGQTWDS